MSGEKKSAFKAIWLGYAGMVLVFLLLGGWLLNTCLLSGEKRPQRKIQLVQLVKPPPPPPPPPPEEPPPRLEEEKIVQPEPEPQPETADSSEEQPAGEDLGVDAEGGAGSDGFGLVGKKGGRSLIGGELGGQSLLRKFAWYNRKLQEQVRREAEKILNKDGGWPKESRIAGFEIELDDDGRVVDFRLTQSSGNDRMDRALLEALKVVRLDEPPPADMPHRMEVRIASQG